MKRLALFLLRLAPRWYPRPQWPFRRAYAPWNDQRWRIEKALRFHGTHKLVGPIWSCLFCGRDDVADDEPCTGEVSHTSLYSVQKHGGDMRRVDP